MNRTVMNVYIKERKEKTKTRILMKISNQTKKNLEWIRAEQNRFGLKLA